jgi:Glycosyl transferase 4-like domain
VIRLFTPHASRSSDPTLERTKANAIRLVERSIVTRCDPVIAVSQAESDYAVEMGIRRDRVRCIPNGIKSNQL